MANFSTDDLKASSKTDLFSFMSKSLSLKGDYSSVKEDDRLWKYLAKTFSNNSKSLKTSISNILIKENTSVNYYKNLPGAMPVYVNEMLKAQNTNAPWLLNILKRKFHRSRKHKHNRQLSNEIDSTLTNDGTGRKWTVHEKDTMNPLTKNSDFSTAGQLNASRAISSTISALPVSTDDSSRLCHYHYDFETANIPNTTLPSVVAVDHYSNVSKFLIDENPKQISNDETTPVDFTSVVSMVKNYSTSKRQKNDVSHIIKESEMPSSFSPSLLSSTIKSFVNDTHLASGNTTVQTTSKRAKSASAARSHYAISSSSKKREKGRSESTKKKKSKYYQEHMLSTEEIELREALRIIDLDNIGFFPPSELRKVLKDIGIKLSDIEKIERCLPLDVDGHYSLDNLIKLFLDTK